jgi:Zn-finger nucleic acid-binding protein
MFPNIIHIDNCPACEGSGHMISRGEIIVINDPNYNIPSYKLNIRVDHCIHCKGSGVIEQRIKKIPEPTLSKIKE